MQGFYKQKPLRNLKKIKMTKIISSSLFVIITCNFYHFCTLSLNFLNILTIAFGDYFLTNEQQNLLLNILFILFFIDFLLKVLSNEGLASSFRDVYNFVDFLCLITYGIYRLLESLNYVDSLFKSTRFLLAIQPVRAFRFLQYLSFMSTIQLVARKTLSDYLPLAIILFVILYVYTLFGLQIFFKYSKDPQFPLNFQDFFTGFASCFSILTLDNWYTFLSYYMPSNNRASVFFFTLTLFMFGNFVLLDLFIAAMLNGFEFFCLKETQLQEKHLKNDPLFIDTWLETQEKDNKTSNSLRTSMMLADENMQSDNRSAIFTRKLYRKMTKYISVFSGYWAVKSNQVTRFLKLLVKTQIFYYFFYLIIWFACIEMTFESFFINMRNYEKEMKGNIFIVNINLNLFFAIEIMLKFYIRGIKKCLRSRDGLFFLAEIINNVGFFTYFLFEQKNFLLQVFFCFMEYIKYLLDFIDFKVFKTFEIDQRACQPSKNYGVFHSIYFRSAQRYHDNSVCLVFF